MLITERAFAQLWLIIYKKNIVSATINLPLFQLAKKETMSFRIMQNYKIFAMSSIVELLY